MQPKNANGTWLYYDKKEGGEMQWKSILFNEINISLHYLGHTFNSSVGTRIQSCSGGQREGEREKRKKNQGRNREKECGIEKEGERK